MNFLPSNLYFTATGLRALLEPSSQRSMKSDFKWSFLNFSQQCFDNTLEVQEVPQSGSLCWCSSNYNSVQYKQKEEKAPCSSGMNDTQRGGSATEKM
jgi:hypothetical protein